VGHLATELMNGRIHVCVHCSLERCSVRAYDIMHSLRYQNSARLYLSLNRDRINRSTLGRRLTADFRAD
jgi:hypothetical protein